MLYMFTRHALNGVLSMGFCRVFESNTGFKMCSETDNFIYDDFVKTDLSDKNWIDIHCCQKQNRI